MSMAYQRAKEAMNRAVEDATSAATELGQSEEPSVEDSAPAVAEEPEEPVAMSAFEESASPILKQYQELKKKHPDSMLLFRCGDFYESYDDDAQKISEVLGITLTRRSSDNTRMAGFPYHALDTYLPKLIRSGIRVAICDQLEEKPQPKKRGRKPKVQEPELNIEPAE